jgi:hypothetical protein
MVSKSVSLILFKTFCLAAKVISNRPGVSGSTPNSSIPDVGVYGSNVNLASNGQKINVDSK